MAVGHRYPILLTYVLAFYLGAGRAAPRVK